MAASNKINESKVKKILALVVDLDDEELSQLIDQILYERDIRIRRGLSPSADTENITG